MRESRGVPEERRGRGEAEEEGVRDTAGMAARREAWGDPVVRREAWGDAVVPPPGQGGRPTRVVDADVFRRVSMSGVRESRGLGPEVGTPLSGTLKTRVLQAYPNVPSDSPQERPAVTCFTSKNLGGGTRASVIARSGHGVEVESSAQAEASRWEAICAAEQGTGLSRRRLERLWAEFRVLTGSSALAGGALRRARAENLEGILVEGLAHVPGQQQRAVCERWGALVADWFGGEGGRREEMDFLDAVEVFVRRSAPQNAQRCRAILGAVLGASHTRAGFLLSHDEVVTQMRIFATAQRKTALLRDLRLLPDRVFGRAGREKENNVARGPAALSFMLSVEEFCELAATTCVGLVIKLSKMLGLEDGRLHDAEAVAADTDTEITPERTEKGHPPTTPCTGTAGRRKALPESAGRGTTLRSIHFQNTPSPAATGNVAKGSTPLGRRPEKVATPASERWRRVRETCGSRTPVRRGAALLAEMRVLRGKLWNV